MNDEKWRIIRERSEHHERWLVSTYLNRPFSNVITYFLMDVNVTPNQISAFTIIPSLLTFISYYLGNFVLGGILTQIVSKSTALTERSRELRIYHRRSAAS